MRRRDISLSQDEKLRSPCVFSFRKSLRGSGGSKSLTLTTSHWRTPTWNSVASTWPHVPVEPGHSYRLLYGNQKAASTEYDFGRVFGGSKRKVLILAHLGRRR